MRKVQCIRCIHACLLFEAADSVVRRGKPHTISNVHCMHTLLRLSPMTLVFVSQESLKYVAPAHNFAGQTPMEIAPVEIWRRILDDLLFDPNLFQPSFVRLHPYARGQLEQSTARVRARRLPYLLVCRAWTEYILENACHITEQPQPTGGKPWVLRNGRVAYIGIKGPDRPLIDHLTGPMRLQLTSASVMLVPSMKEVLFEQLATFPNLRNLALYLHNNALIRSRFDATTLAPKGRGIYTFPSLTFLDYAGYLPDTLLLSLPELRELSLYPIRSVHENWHAVLDQHGSNLKALALDVRSGSLILHRSLWTLVPRLEVLCCIPYKTRFRGGDELLPDELILPLHLHTIVGLSVPRSTFSRDRITAMLLSLSQSVGDENPRYPIRIYRVGAAWEDMGFRRTCGDEYEQPQEAVLVWERGVWATSKSLAERGIRLEDEEGRILSSHGIAFFEQS